MSISSVHSTKSLHTEKALALTGSKVKLALIPERITDEGTITGGVGHTRSTRYALQKTAKNALSSFDTPKNTPFKVMGCLSSLITGSQNVQILKNNKTDVCHFANLQRCGSVWTCPVCSAAITQQRAKEVVNAQDSHFKNGGQTLMITLTHSHKLHDKLVNTVPMVALALQKYRNSRQYKALLESIGYTGLIRALETTYSDNNGFHVHTHELLFVNSDSLNIKKITDVLFYCWSKACKSVGLGVPSRSRGVDVKESFSPSDYLAKFGLEQKWGAGAELVKSHVKNGRAASLTMFDFLRIAQTTKDDAQKQKYIKLFQEFSFCFYGKRQLYWTNGLKKQFSIVEVTDDEIMNETMEDAEVIAVISKGDWFFVRSLSFDVRGSLLRYAELGGWSAVSDYIYHLKESYS
jgi:hypothetical protein